MSFSADECGPNRVCVRQGPVLRSIQRFGRLGKRSGNVPPEARHSKDKIKEAKYMYLSIDEAGTHVNVRRFRCPSLTFPSFPGTDPYERMGNTYYRCTPYCLN